MSDIASTAHPAKSQTGKAPVLQQNGALPWRIDRHGFVEVLLVTRGTDGQWTLPKGAWDDGRSLERAAARAAFEQAGVIGQPHATPIGGYRYMKGREERAAEPCHVTLFALHVKGTLLNWLERDRRRRSWRPLGDAADLIAEPELSRLLRSLQFNPGAFR